MIHSVAGSLPKHQYVYVDSHFTHKEPCGFQPAVWFGLVSIPGRMWGCNVMFEDGAVYRNVPLHAIAFREDCETNWTECLAQKWDCYGTDFATIEYPYLSGLDCLAKADSLSLIGQYIFTAIPCGDGFSNAPDQAKEFTFVRLNNGRLTVQPTDRIVFLERSFTRQYMEFPVVYKRQTEVWSCE